MRVKKEDIKRLGEAMAGLMIKMQEVDGRCVALTEDITKQELTLIGFIGQRGPSIMRDIANYLNVPFSTATGIVDKLVGKKYLARFHSQEDRRIVMVKLDDQGCETCDLFNTMKAEMGKRLLSELTEDEKEGFITVLEKITSNLTQQQVVEKHLN